ncbi:MAG: hypothetical protein H6671_04890 [Anaerolineaceae bacterium]|nr:hypothetical protein [Anaerolineaceae bacterium]
MKKQILPVLILIIMVMVLTSGAASAQNTAHIGLESQMHDVQAGDEFTVTVQIVGAESVYGVSFKLSYDPAILEVVPTNNQVVTPAEFFSSGPNFTLKNTADAGVIEYALTLTQPADPVSGDGVLGMITFRALAGGTVEIAPIEASLVAPQFEEVDGLRVARSIQQVATDFEGMTVQVNGGGNAVVSAPVSSVSVATASLANRQVSQANQTEAAVAASSPSPDNQSLLTLAGFFLLGGILLLVVSIGLYSRMRAQLELAG